MSRNCQKLINQIINKSVKISQVCLHVSNFPNHSSLIYYLQIISKLHSLEFVIQGMGVHCLLECIQNLCLNFGYGLSFLLFFVSVLLCSGIFYYLFCLPSTKYVL